MSFVPDPPRLEGRWANPGPQRITPAWTRRFLNTLMNRDGLRLTDTTKNSSSTTTAPLIPPQRYSSPSPANTFSSLTALGIGTTPNITARNSAATRNLAFLADAPSTTS